MSGYWLRIGTPEEEYPTDDRVQSVKVYYSLPGLGFTAETRVTAETARLLKIAIEQGKNEARAEIRKALNL